MLVTSLVTSQLDVKLSLLHSCLNEITTFFTVTIQLFDVLSLNFMCGCTMDVKPRMSKEIGDGDVIDDIIKSKSRSAFWTAVTLLIFKLERWTTLKMWRIGLAIWMLCWFQNLLNHYSCRHYVTSYHHFGNFGKYAISDCFFICLFVCLSVRNVVSRIQVAPVDQSSPNLTQTCILVRAGNTFNM